MSGPGFARPDLCSIRTAGEQEERAEAVRGEFSADGYPLGDDDPPVPLTSAIDRAIRLSTAVAVLAVAGIAAYVSYWHAYAVVRAYGETGITARLEPATIDGLVYASSMVMLYAARHRVPVPSLARWLLGLGIVATLTANMAQGWPHGLVGAVVAVLAALGPADGPDVRGLPDGTLLHLRDTYPVETGWAPRYVGDELRQVRAAAWHARLAALRASAEAKAAAGRGQHDHAAQQHQLGDSYLTLHEAYRERETVFAAIMADRADWDTATRAQRHLAVAADTELRRRHPGQRYPPLRSAEPQPATQAQRAELTLTPGQPVPEMGQWIKDLAATHRTFAGKLAERQSLTVPSEDPDYGDLGQAFPPWPGPRRDAILQPPKPEIRPSPQVLQRAAERDADPEAAD
jgi:hypothetical protein